MPAISIDEEQVAITGAPKVNGAPVAALDPMGRVIASSGLG